MFGGKKDYNEKKNFIKIHLFLLLLLLSLLAEWKGSPKGRGYMYVYG